MASTGVIAYSYANRTGTRPLSEKGPAFMVLGKFAGTDELLAHIRRVYPKGPNCTILQTSKNTFFPLLAPKTVMLKYPVHRAQVHTKALIGLFQARRAREKKEFDEARRQQKPGRVNKDSRETKKAMKHLQDIGMEKKSESKETDSTSNDKKSTQKGTKSASKKKKIPVVAPLDPRVKLCNQNYAVVSVIHDERKSNKNGNSAEEPLVSILDTFDTEESATKFAEKAYSQEAREAPLFVVNMYAWLWTNDISLSNIKVRYPETPILEEAVRNHQELQRKGEEQYINDQKKKTSDKMPCLDADRTPGDAKVPPTSTDTEGSDLNKPGQDLNRLMSKDDTTDIITRRLLERNSTSNNNDEKKNES